MYVIYVSEPLEKPPKLCGQREREKLTPPHSFHSKPRIVVSFGKCPQFPFMKLKLHGAGD
jgi:hypothetical protein